MTCHLDFELVCYVIEFFNVLNTTMTTGPWPLRKCSWVVFFLSDYYQCENEANRLFQSGFRSILVISCWCHRCSASGPSLCRFRELIGSIWPEVVSWMHSYFSGKFHFFEMLQNVWCKYRKIKGQNCI